jgi:hypothetical protein
MRMLFRTRWLFPILLIGLAVLFVKLPTTSPDQALANTSLPAEKAGAPAEADAGPAGPAPAQAQVDEPAIQGGETPEAAQAEFDNTSCGTY